MRHLSWHNQLRLSEILEGNKIPHKWEEVKRKISNLSQEDFNKLITAIEQAKVMEIRMFFANPVYVPNQHPPIQEKQS